MNPPEATIERLLHTRLAPAALVLIGVGAVALIRESLYHRCAAVAGRSGMTPGGLVFHSSGS